LNERESLVKAMKMIPVECVVRNVCAGSMAKRYGIAGDEAAGAYFRILPEERRVA
jgi:phosphoribosylaminoimidazole-succinocarboxamide synthase